MEGTIFMWARLQNWRFVFSTQILPGPAFPSLLKANTLKVSPHQNPPLRKELKFVLTQLKSLVKKRVSFLRAVCILTEAKL